MSTYSETILERYQKVEAEPDAFGRTIKVQRLKPWNDAVVRRIAASDTLSVTSMILVASSVCEIMLENGKVVKYAPPTNEDDVEIIMNVLDNEGLAAALKAYQRLIGIKMDRNLEGEEAVIDAAKNLPATEG